MQQLSGTRQRAGLLLAAVLLSLTTTNGVLLAQNMGAARVAITSSSLVSGARLVKGHHVRIR